MRPLWTEDGSPSAYSERYGEYFHPLEGARRQAEELFVRLSGIGKRQEARVVEVGFGLGINFLASVEALRRRGGTLYFIGLEPEPLPASALDELLFGCRFAPDARQTLLHAWETRRDFVVAGEGFLLKVQFAPIASAVLPEGWADAVYYDPFSPRANPEAWRPENLARAKRALAPGGVLVSYAVAGWVRRALEELGFAVEKVPGTMKKREWLRARRTF